MSEIPEKSFYKVNEICQYTDTQPYVLRFWESEFPQLAPHKNKTGQRVYTRRDLDLVLRIKRLLHDEEYTIAGARARLEEEGDEGPRIEDTRRTPLEFLPDGDEPSASASARQTSSSAAAAAAAASSSLFEEPAAVPTRKGRPAPEVPDVPHAVSALETPFIPAPPVTDPTHLRQELAAERERADALHAKLEQARSRQETAAREHDEVLRTIENQRQTISTLRHELESAKAKAARLDAAEAALADLQDKGGEAARMLKDNQRLEEALADAKAALETERETLVHERAAADALRGRLHAVEAAAAENRARLDAAEAEAVAWRSRARRASAKVADVASTLREVLVR